MKRQRWLLVTSVLILVTALGACGRSGDETEEGGGDEPAGEESEAGGSGEGRLANGEFGDLGAVCQDGEPGAASETGLSDTEIQVGVVTDKGFTFRAGLNKEMYDVAVAFAAWCNENGGINGRQIVVNDRDAAFTAYNDVVAAGCTEDFAFVGGGAVQDNTDNGARVECGLVNMPAFAVTAEARASELQLQAIPTPVYEIPVQLYRTVREQAPDATRFGVMWGQAPGITMVHAQVTEAVQAEGFELAFDREYNPVGEASWRPFVEAMRDEDVQVFEFIGEPDFLSAVLQEMQIVGWYPEYITMQPNMYDQRLADQAAASAGEATYVRSIFPPFFMADEAPAVADYLELMETYNPDGKTEALLGVQALSAWLLFAQSAVACGEELSRACVLSQAGEVTEWTAGGLHAPTQPGNTEVPPCGLLLQFTTEGFTYAEDLTNPDEGLFNCDEANVRELEDDYGVPRPGS